MKPVLTRVLRSLQSNILAGLLTVGPLFVTFLIQFCGGELAKAGYRWCTCWRPSSPKGG